MADEVAQALHDGRPVVALESTIISHGMPYPQNAETAMGVEAVVRARGAVPATVYIDGGMIHVGASEDAVERLASEGAKGNVQKCSRRDVGVALARGGMGATTVSTTMIGAAAAGVEVFATGGIGGVHRGVSESWDISADLTELGRTPVTVVCAGVKSILDVPKTLEALETLGVPVLALGQDRFPAFFTNDAGIDSPARVDSVEEAARIVQASRDAGMDHGILLAVPNPEPADGDVVAEAIRRGLAAVAEQGVTGKAVTPFLLRFVAEATGGHSLASNIALVRHNAATAAALAGALALGRPRFAAAAGAAAAGQRRGVHTATGRRGAPGAGGRTVGSRGLATWRDSASMPAPAAGAGAAGIEGRVVVLGSTLMDVVARSGDAGQLPAGTSTPGSTSMQLGGVGRNVAEGASRLGARVALSSSAGLDALGDAARAGTEAAGVEILEPFGMEGRVTASYTALLHGDGEMMAAVADAAAIDAIGEDEALQRVRAACMGEGGTGILVLDAGLSPRALLAACAGATERAVRGEGTVRHATPPRSLEAAMRSQGIDPQSSAAEWDEETRAMADAVREHLEQERQEYRARTGLDVPPEDEVIETPVWAGRGPPVIVEPVSVAKARRVGQPGVLAQAAVVTPNAAEVHAMAEAFQEAARGTPIGEISPPLAQAMQVPGANRFASSGAMDSSLARGTEAMRSGDAGEVARSIQEMMEGAGGGEDGGGMDIAAMAREAGLDTMSFEDLRRVGAVTADAERYLEASGMGEDELSAAFDDFKAALEGGTLEDHIRNATAEDGEAGEEDQAALAAALGQGSDVEAEHMSPALLGAVQVVLAAMCNPAVELTGVGLVEGRKHVVVTLGAEGVLWASKRPAVALEGVLATCGQDFLTTAAMGGLDFRLVHAPRLAVGEIVNVTGAGDSLVGGMAAALQAGYPMAQAILWGMAASQLSLRERPAVARAMSSREELLLALRAVCDANQNEPDEDGAVEALRKQVETHLRA